MMMIVIVMMIASYTNDEAFGVSRSRIVIQKGVAKKLKKIIIFFKIL